MSIQFHDGASCAGAANTPGPVLTLLTDFGTSSGYVAQMELLLREAVPEARVIHIAHDLAAHDVQHAAWLLYSVVRGLPPAPRLHIAVVDPGVGSARSVLYVQALGQSFLAPNNGLLSHILDLDPAAVIREAPAASPCALHTFHGRDHFVPLAIDTLQGKQDWSLCPILEDVQMCTRRLDPQLTEEGVLARVLHCDTFGNMITQLRAEHVFQGPAPSNWVVASIPGFFELNQMPIGVYPHYAEIPQEQAGVILGSSGHWEVAMRETSAAAVLGDAALLSFQFS